MEQNSPQVQACPEPAAESGKESTAQAEEDDQRSSTLLTLRTLFSKLTQGFAFGTLAFDAAGNAVDARLLDANETFLRHTGLTPQAVGHPLRNALSGVARFWVDRYIAVAATGQSVDFEDYDSHAGRHYEQHAFSPAPGHFAVLCSDITGRKRTEQGLRDSENWLHQVIAGIPGTVWTASADGKINFVSPQWLAYTGMTGRDAAGDGWMAALHPDDSQAVIQHWCDAVHARKCFNMEYRVRSHNGSYRWFAVRATPIFDDSDQLMRWFGVSTDIEDLKRSQEQLAQSEQRYTALFANRTNAIAHCSAIVNDDGHPVDFRMERLNDACERIIGRSRSEVEGRPATEVFPDLHKLDFDMIGTIGRIALLGGEESFELYFRPTRQWLSAYGYSATRGECILIFSDISAQKRVEAALRESETMLRATFEQAGVGITHVSPAGYFLRANRKFCDLIGYSESELRDLRIADITHPADLDVGTEEFRRTMRGELPSYTVEKRYRCKKGAVIWARVTGTPVLDPQTGRAKYNVAVIEDITVSKEVQQELQRERAQLQAILDNAPVLVSIKNLQGTIVLANKAFDILDVEGSLVGRNLFELMPPDRAQALWANDLAALHSDGPVRAEEVVRHRDGSWHTYLTIKFPVRHPGASQPHGICAISTDITESKDAESERERLVNELRATAEHADRSRAQLETVFQSIDDGIAVFDMDGRQILHNTALARINGMGDDGNRNQSIEYFSEHFQLTQPDGTPVPPSDWPVARVLRGESLQDLELYAYREGAEPCVFSFSGAPVRDEQGRQVRALVVVRDVTQRKRLEAAREESERRLQLAVSVAHVGLWEWEFGSNECYYSPEWKSHIGYAEHEMSNSFKEWGMRLHPEEREQVLQEVAEYFAHPVPDFKVHYRLRHRDGSYRWLVSNAVPLETRDGRVRFIGTQLDVTESKLIEQRVLEAAQHDALTGLPNRALVFEYAGHLLAAARRNHGRGAFLFVDLDRFKPVNDLYGHEVGDKLLQEVAKRLSACVRDEDLVGRIGGDEFVIVLPYLTDGVPAATVAQHVLEALSRPFAIDALDLSISASIGISHFPQHGTDVDALIHAADLAMYHTKHGGRGAFSVFTPELNHRADAATSIEDQLKRALRQNTLALHYQPVIDMTTRRVIGAEALLRLPARNGHTVGPDRFVPIAESAGLIGQLGEWVAIEACRQHEEWRRLGIPPFPVAINVSPLQFRQRGFAERLQSIVRESGMDPSCIQIEVTESTVMDNVDDAIQTLNSIRDIGIRIALDDFGTGYSSLSHLSHLPLDKLKVDQSFVQRLEHDRASRAITGAVITLGRTLNLEVVGEGIESEDALAYLQEHGCDQAQGFLISRPLAAPDFMQWYRAHL